MSANTACIFTRCSINLSQAKAMQALYEAITSSESCKKLSLDLGKDGPEGGPLASNGIFSSALARKLLSAKRKDVDLFENICNLIDKEKISEYLIQFVCSDTASLHKILSVKARIAEKYKTPVVVIYILTDASELTEVSNNRADCILDARGYTSDTEKIGNDKQQICKTGLLLPSELTEKLSENCYEEKKLQLYKSNKQAVNIAVIVNPNSVKPEYYLKMIDNLSRKSRKCAFFVAGISDSKNKTFFSELSKYPNVKTYAARSVCGLLSEYVKIYKTNVISLEVSGLGDALTGLSLPTDCQGGALNLITPSIINKGHTDLQMTEENQLVLSNENTGNLWGKALKSVSMGENEIMDIFSDRSIRGMRLPQDPHQASGFIWWCLYQGIFEVMLSEGLLLKGTDQDSGCRKAVKAIEMFMDS